MADKAITIGKAKVIDNDTIFKIEYNGTVRLIINKSTGALTLGSADGTGTLLGQLGSLTVGATSGYSEDFAVEGDSQMTGYLKMTGTTAYFLPPKLTSTQRDALTAVSGMVIYNTTTNKLQVHNGTAWTDLH